MPSRNHTITITPLSIEGVMVYDLKRPKGVPPQQLNKISIIASFVRNRNMETTIPSRPLIPGKNHRQSMKINKGGLRYMAMWENNHNEKNVENDKDNDYNRNPNVSKRNGNGAKVAMETNLHKKAKRADYETKTYDVVVGLKRGDTSVVIAVSVLNVNGPTEGEVELELPLCPIGMEYMEGWVEDRTVNGLVQVKNIVRGQKSGKEETEKEAPLWNMDPVQFDEDVGRSYILTQDAALKVKIEVIDTQKLHLREMESYLNSHKKEAVLKKEQRPVSMLPASIRSLGAINLESIDNQTPTRNKSKKNINRNDDRFSESTGKQKDLKQKPSRSSRPTSAPEFSIREANNVPMANEWGHPLWGRQRSSEYVNTQESNIMNSVFSSNRGTLSSRHQDGGAEFNIIGDNEGFGLGGGNGENQNMIFYSLETSAEQNESFRVDVDQQYSQYGDMTMHGTMSNMDGISAFGMNDEQSGAYIEDDNMSKFTLSEHEHPHAHAMDHGYDGHHLNMDSRIGSDISSRFTLSENGHPGYDGHPNMHSINVSGKSMQYLNTTDSVQYGHAGDDFSLEVPPSRYGAHIPQQYRRHNGGGRMDMSEPNSCYGYPYRDYGMGKYHYNDPQVHNRAINYPPITSHHNTHGVTGAGYASETVDQSAPLYDDKGEHSTKKEDTAKQLKDLYTRFLDGIFGTKETTSQKDNVSKNYSQETPPQQVSVDETKSVAHTEITNFTQDSFEKYERPNFLPMAFGGNGIFRPSSRQAPISSHFRNQPQNEDPYANIGRMKNMRSGHHVEHYKSEEAASQFRDDTDSYSGSGDSDTYSESWSANDTASYTSANYSSYG